MALFQNTLPADSIRVNTSHPPVSRWRFSVLNDGVSGCGKFEGMAGIRKV